MRGGSQPAAPSFAADTAELARAYEEVSRDRQFVAGQRLVQALQIRSGERVLDVGCGTGMLAGHVAALVGPAGHVLGIDAVSQRIAVARARARPVLAFEVADATDLSFLGSATYDVVLLNAVFHWLTDKAAALRGFRRVLRPGGRLGIAGTAKEQRSPLRGVLGRVLGRSPFARYPRPAPELSVRVDAAEMAALLGEAGFSSVSIQVYDSPIVYPSAESVMRYAEASSFGNLLRHLPEELRPLARSALVEELSRSAAPDGSLRQESQRMIALALRPTV